MVSGCFRLPKSRIFKNNIFSEDCSFKPHQNLTKSKDLFERQPCSAYPRLFQTPTAMEVFRLISWKHWTSCSSRTHTGSTTQPVAFEYVGEHISCATKTSTHILENNIQSTILLQFHFISKALSRCPHASR